MIETKSTSDTNRPLILISNDDGYQAKGINQLVRMVKDFGDIIVCAPDGGRSGSSRAFSMDLLRLYHINTEDNVQVWSCTGTPVDCVKMAYSQLYPRKPSLVLSGINHGDNASTNAHYSGTVGVVIEGALKSIPSIAFSLCDNDADADFSGMENIVRQLVADVLENGMPKYSCLNVNVPKQILHDEVKICRMAHGHWRNEVETCHHPARGYDYYWMCGYYQNDEPEATDTDAWALRNGYIAITPTTVELTDFKYLEKLKAQSSL